MMKTLLSKTVRTLCGLTAAACVGSTSYGQNNSQEVTLDANKGVLHIPAVVKQSKVPHFYTTKITSTLLVTDKKLTHTSVLNFKSLQGKVKKYSVGVSRKIQEVQVIGEDVSDWSLRVDQKSGKRYVDFFIKDEKDKESTVTLIVSEKREEREPKFSALSFSPVEGVSSGYFETLKVSNTTGVDLELVALSGYQSLRVEDEKNFRQFVSHTGGSIDFKTLTAAMVADPVRLLGLNVSTSVLKGGKSAKIDVSGNLVTQFEKGGSIGLLSGRAALLDYPDSEDFVVSHKLAGTEHLYTLATKKKGNFSFNLSFVVKVEEVSGWKRLAFKMSDGTIVPVSLSGLKSSVGGRDLVFDRKKVVVPTAYVKPFGSFELAETKAYSAFVPSDGKFDVAWKAASDARKASRTFFTTKSSSDVTVGGGLVKQRMTFNTRVLQGKVSKFLLKKIGEGDITNVQGSHVSHWKITENGDLEIVLTGAYGDVAAFAVEAQNPLGALPATLEPVRLTPSLAERHTGFVRVSNQGAVNVDVTDVKGMMQVNPSQYPILTKKVFHQVSVYKFPTQERSWKIRATQILPEISIDHTLLYGVYASDRIVIAEVNLDVREAALREWLVRIPDSYAVSSVTRKGKAVGDYVLSKEVVNGMRDLKILFSQPVLGTHSVRIAIEANIPAEEGEWKLPQITYPDVKDVRGQIGVMGQLGWKVSGKVIDQLTEIPLAYFRKRSESVQQAYRQRKKAWNATVKLEKKAQSVHADVVHLYTLKESIAECVVSLNYVVIGAPVDTLRIQIPKDMENVILEGHRTFKREGEHIVAKLERPSIGNVNLLLKFEQQISSEKGELILGQVIPLGVQSESGYVQVVSPKQVKFMESEENQGVLTLDKAELPREIKLLSSLPTVGAWQYGARPFKLGVNLQWFSTVDQINQSIDYAKVLTSITKRGEVKNTAVFFVKSRGKQLLRMKLPSGAEYWGGTANGRVVNARKDGDFLLFPMPAQNDLNTPVEVKVNYGMKVAESGKIGLELPVFSSPSVVTNWKVSSLDGNLIVPVGGNAVSQQPTAGQDWFGWVFGKMKFLGGILLLLVGGALISATKKKTWWKMLIGAAWLILAAGMSLKLADEAKQDVVGFDTSLDVVAPVVNANSLVTLEIEQFTTAEAMVSKGGVGLAALGLILVIACLFIPVLRKFGVTALGIVAISAGLLLQHNGAQLFFGFLALLAIVCLVLRLLSNRSVFRMGTKEVGTAASVIALLFSFSPQAEANVASIHEDWNIKEERLTAQARIVWDAKLGEKVEILRGPAILSGFEAESCSVVKGSIKGQTIWYAVAEETGKQTVRVSYKRPMLNLAENNWGLVTPTAVARSMSIKIDKAGWEVTSDSAVQAKHDQKPKSSVSDLVLLPDNVSLRIQPKKIDPDSVAVKYFTQVTDLFVPSPGVLDGTHEVKVNLISGRLRQLEVRIPEGMMVGGVDGIVVDDWKFDPRKRLLHVQFTKPMSREFSFVLATQRALKALPVKVELEPVQVIGASKIVGMLGVGFGDDAQSNAIVAGKLNVANIDDFSKTLSMQARAKKAGFTLHKAYRYSDFDEKVKFTVQAVEAELRAVTDEKLHVRDERYVFNSFIKVSVKRAGVFKLNLVVPEGFEVESVNGDALRNYTETDVNGKRVLTLHLKGKKQGDLSYNAVFTKVRSAKQTEWAVPKLELEGATRQSGSLVVYPQHGIQVSAVSRSHVTQGDARVLRRKHPGALVFGILQKNSKLKISITKLQPRLRCEILQEIVIREGQSRSRIGMGYHVSHAAVKELLIELPGLSEEEESTVRVSGAEVKSIAKVKGSLWKVSLRRGVIGAFRFDVEFQTSPKREDGVEKIAPILLRGVYQHKHYVAIRANERLDMQAVDKGKGWRVFDWKSVPESLRHVTNSSIPELTYQLLDDSSLLVKVSRYAMADALKLKVLAAEIQTIFSTTGSAVNHLILGVDVIEKSSMKVHLPEKATLYGVLVNGDSVPVVRGIENRRAGGQVIRFNVAPAITKSSNVAVRVIYSNEGVGGKIGNALLQAPRLDIPMEKVRWKVILPKGIKLKGFSGDFSELVSSSEHEEFTEEIYKNMVKVNRNLAQRRAQGMMRDVNQLIKSGEHDKAQEILSQVYRNKSVGRDMNEDAYEKLTKFQLQNALMGLNTRRQRMYLENKAEGNIAGNSALEEAASRNPLFNGSNRYDPNQVGDFMQGMTEDEKANLEKIARIFVSNDADDTVAPQTIEVTMPEMGTVLEFERKVQLGTGGDVRLQLELEETSRSKQGAMLLVLSLVALAAALMCWRRS